MSNCLVCGSSGAENHHIKTRGSGGTDDPWNLMPLDRKCHQEVHAIGMKRFSEKYSIVLTFLKRNGWMFTNLGGRWKLEREN